MNTELPQKHINCPVCNSKLTSAEYDAQECWNCRWPYNSDDDSAENIAHNRQMSAQINAVHRGVLPLLLSYSSK